MTKKYIKFIFSVLSIIFLVNSFFNVQFCQAGTTGQDLWTQLDNAGNTGWGAKADKADMPKIIQTAISAFLGLLGIIFLVLIIYAGYNWMTAQGDEEKVTKAKDTLTRAVIGLIIITMAYAITYFVFSNLPDASGSTSAGGGGAPL